MAEESVNRVQEQQVAFARGEFRSLSPQRERFLACWAVRQVWDLLKDERFRVAIEVAERFARGEATAKELAAAQKMVGEEKRSGWARYNILRTASRLSAMSAAAIEAEEAARAAVNGDLALAASNAASAIGNAARGRLIGSRMEKLFGPDIQKRDEAWTFEVDALEKEARKLIGLHDRQLWKRKGGSGRNSTVRMSPMGFGNALM